MSGCRGWYKNVTPLTILSQEGTRFSQGSVVTHLRCGGIFTDVLWKSVGIWWSFGQERSGTVLSHSNQCPVAEFFHVTLYNICFIVVRQVQWGMTDAFYSEKKRIEFDFGLTLLDPFVRSGLGTHNRLYSQYTHQPEFTVTASWELEDFVGVKFCCPHATYNWCSHIREKTLEFSLSVLHTPSLNHTE